VSSRQLRDKYGILPCGANEQPMIFICMYRLYQKVTQKKQLSTILDGGELSANMLFLGVLGNQFTSQHFTNRGFGEFSTEFKLTWYLKFC